MPITVQDTYLTGYAQGFPGMLADGNTQSRPTGIAADAAGIAFGKAVFSTGVGKQVTATPGTKFKGIVIADSGIVPGLTGTADVHPQYSTMSLLDMGDIWVLAGSNTTKDAAAYVTSAGAFTTTASGNTAIPATFMDAVSSGAPVRLRVVQQ
ncbi:structural cement protein Gp24 [Sphingomonas sp. NPDC019816]|uniref:structural cement protein Gp24 n=1 Tax=Sphingomonas sp. NPDC019816 TaxID=3390679 RepID=UPI003D008BBF